MKKNFLRLSIILVLIMTFIATVIFCCTKPKMHKPFEISVIEYIIKINKDGSTTYTKEVTTTKIKEHKE